MMIDLFIFSKIITIIYVSDAIKRPRFNILGLYFRDEAYRHPRYYDPEHPRIDRVGLQGDAMDIEVCTENPMLEEDIRLFYNVLGEDGELLGERFSVLARLLREMGY